MIPMRVRNEPRISRIIAKTTLYFKTSTNAKTTITNPPIANPALKINAVALLQGSPKSLRALLKMLNHGE